MSDLSFADDARWDGERECVEVTAVLHDPGGARRFACAISLEALESLVQLPSRPNPLRLFRDFEPRLAEVAARKAVAQVRAGGDVGEVVVTGRDLKPSTTLSLGNGGGPSDG